MIAEPAGSLVRNRRPIRTHRLHPKVVGALLLTLLLNLHAEEGGSRLRNPYGLTEDEMDGLLVRSPVLRDFAEFFSYLLLNTEMDRMAALAVYQPIRRLNMHQRDAFGTRIPISEVEVQRQVNRALWELDSPELLKISLLPAAVALVRPWSLRFTSGLENRLPVLIRNGTSGRLTVRVTSGSDDLAFPTLKLELDPGQVYPAMLRVWGHSRDQLVLRIAAGGTVEEDLSLPLNWRASSRLLIRVFDEDGSLVPARVHLRGSDGRGRGPSGTYLRSAELTAEPYFHTQGVSSVVLPAGETEIFAVRGPEYAAESRIVSLPPDAFQVEEFRLKRIVDPAARGWYSGDIHIHPNLVHKTMAQLVNPEDIRLQVQAEDLNVANLLICNSQGTVVYDRQRFTGAPHPLSTPNHILYWNEEFRPWLYGHMALLNLKKFVEPPYSGFPNSPNPFDYPPNTSVARRAQKEGIAVFYVHPGSRTARPLAVDAALGTIDGMEILGYANTEVSTDIYHRLLNCGFQLSAAAGTDTFNNIRRHKVIGGDRVYVHTGGKLTYQDWIVGLKKGRTFVSNAPLLFFEVEGKLPGSQLALNQPGPIRVKVEAFSQVPMGRLDLIANGKIIHSVAADEAGRELRYEGEIELTESAWVAARVTGGRHRLLVNNPTLFAHTTPVHCVIQGKPFVDPDSVRYFLDRIEELRQVVLTKALYESPSQQLEALAAIDEAVEIYRDKLGSEVVSSEQ